MACNTPVVSTPVGNVQDLIGDVVGCYISKTFSCEELADLVIKSLTNKHFVGRQKLLEKKLDSKSVASNLFNIYKSLPKSKSLPKPKKAEREVDTFG